MKKLVLFFVVMTLISLPIHAQLSLGAKGGVNFASLTGDDADMLDLNGRTTLHFGAVGNLPISELLAVQAEVVYSAQGFTLEESFEGMTFEGTGKLDYINIPILADFTVLEGLSLQGGPQVGFLITDELEFEDETESLDAESIDFSAAIGAQYRLPMGLFFQARYTIGFNNVAGEDSAEEDVDLKNGVFSLSAGWFFN